MGIRQPLEHLCDFVPSAHHYRAAAVMLATAANTSSNYNHKELENTLRTQAPYVAHKEPYITWLTQPEYVRLPQGLLGITTPSNRWSAVDERLSPTWRHITAAHENMHVLRYLVGADRYLSRVEAENANRDNTEAQLGPELAALHARLGRIPKN